VFDHTQNAQVAFSPEFTICNSCHKTTRGLKKKCRFCQSREVDWITRVTGYYSFVKQWNPGKRKELEDRFRNIKLNSNKK